MGTFRARVFAALNSEGALGRRVSRVLLYCIILSVAMLVMESVEWIRVDHGVLFERLNGAIMLVFVAEYILRLWTCVEIPTYAHPVLGRVRYALTPFMLIDLLAISPLFLVSLGIDLRSMRLFRTVRLFRVLKIARYVHALDAIKKVLIVKRHQLGVTVGIVFFLLLVTSALMYELEHEAQPHAFSSIPATMWWAVASLTTVGYGDIYPITPLGKLLAAVSAVLGVGLVALPAGILASGFSSQTEAEHSSEHSAVCPHCGRGEEYE
jgi:voltage-gated potassium channel